MNDQNKKYNVGTCICEKSGKEWGGSGKGETEGSYKSETSTKDIDQERDRGVDRNK